LVSIKFIDALLYDVSVPDVIRIKNHTLSFPTEIHSSTALNCQPIAAADNFLLAGKSPDCSSRLMVDLDKPVRCTISLILIILSMVVVGAIKCHLLSRIDYQ
jgi:hypothetical protein